MRFDIRGNHMILVSIRRAIADRLWSVFFNAPVRRITFTEVESRLNARCECPRSASKLQFLKTRSMAPLLDHRFIRV